MQYSQARKASLCLIIASTILIPTGCGKKFSLASPPAPALVNKTRYTPDDYKRDLGDYNTNVTSNATLAQQIRNRIAYGFMAEIDDAFGMYTAGLFAGKGTIGVAGDSVQLGMTAAATIATHTPTKTILSALATGLTGVNLSFDKNFFAQQTFQTIAIAMQTRRDKGRAVITTNLAKSVGDYPLAAARRDLVSYFYAGTLPGGLQELQEQAGAAANAQSSKDRASALH